MNCGIDLGDMNLSRTIVHCTLKAKIHVRAITFHLLFRFGKFFRQLLSMSKGLSWPWLQFLVRELVCVVVKLLACGTMSGVWAQVSPLQFGFLLLWYDWNTVNRLLFASVLFSRWQSFWEYKTLRICLLHVYWKEKETHILSFLTSYLYWEH